MTNHDVGWSVRGGRAADMYGNTSWDHDGTEKGDDHCRNATLDTLGLVK